MAKVINFVGADHKVGVTMLVQSIADSISVRRPNLRVLILHLDGNDGTDYMVEAGHSMDAIFASLMNSMTEYSEVEALLYKTKNISVLTGSKNNDYGVRYTPETVDYLLDICRPYFDLILIDSGASINSNGLAVGAFKYSDENILVTTQNASVFRTFTQRKPGVFDKLDYNVDKLIINKFSWSSGKFLGTQEQIQRSYGFDESFPVEGLTLDIAYQAEYNKKSLYFYKNTKVFKKDIDMLVDYLDIPRAESEKKEK